MNKLVIFSTFPNASKTVLALGIIAIVATLIFMFEIHSSKKRKALVISIEIVVLMLVGLFMNVRSLGGVYDYANIKESEFLSYNSDIGSMYMVMPDKCSNDYYVWCDRIEKVRDKRDTAYYHFLRASKKLEQYKPYLENRYGNLSLVE